MSPGRIAVLIACLCGSGCLQLPQVGWGRRTPPVESYQIDYALADASRALSDENASEWADLVTAAWQDDPPQTAATSEDKAVRLSITYPHPDEGIESALATLTVYDGDTVQGAPHPAGGNQGVRKWFRNWGPRRRAELSDPAKASVVEEVVTLEIPRAQFEMLMSDLSRDSYFDRIRPRRPSATSDVELSIRHKRQAVRQSSIPEPRLDDFIRRVYREGESLVGGPQPQPEILTTSAELAAPRPDRY